MTLTWETVQAFRRNTFRLQAGQHLKTPDEAVQFVQERGFVFFWPIQGFTYPSLWAAVAGDRPVADAHDDPGHVTWGWKDRLLGSRSWYYAKILRKKATMVSMDLVPYFYALSENYGSPEEDYLTLYEQGRMTQEAKAIYETLLEQGSLDTIALRRVTHLSSQTSESRFNRAVSDLQADFKIVPVGVTQSGAWHYAFAYDIVTRHYPDLPEQARTISERDATLEILTYYFRSVGAAQVLEMKKLFGWRLPTIEHTLYELAVRNFVQRGIALEDRPGEWIALSEIIE